MDNEILPIVKNSFYSRYVKRILDIFFSAFAIIVFAPVLLAVYVLELHYHGKPAVYVTHRPGNEGKMFR